MNKAYRRKKIFSIALYVADIMEQTLIDESPEFTGKLHFEINCNNGGIGSVDAFSRMEIKKKVDNSNKK